MHMNLKAQVLRQNVSVKNHSVVYPAQKGGKKKRMIQYTGKGRKREQHTLKTLKFLIPSHQVSIRAQRETVKNFEKKKRAYLLDIMQKVVSSNELYNCSTLGTKNTRMFFLRPF